MTQIEWMAQLPIIPPGLWSLALALALILAILFFRWRKKRTIIFALVPLAFTMAFINPHSIVQFFSIKPPVVLIAVDQSASMGIAERRLITRNAIRDLRAALSNDEELMIDEFYIGSADKPETEIVKPVQEAIGRYDPKQIAGVFIITDGQAHDSRLAPGAWPRDWPPLHLLLTGQPNEKQASLIINPPPAFAIANKTITITGHAIWPNQTADETSILIIEQGTERWTHKITANKPFSVSLPVRHPGYQEFIFSLPPLANNIFPATEKSMIAINAFMPRLHIVWISDQPVPDALAHDPAILITKAWPKADDDVDLFVLSRTNLSKQEQEALRHYLENDGAILMLAPPPMDWQPELLTHVPLVAAPSYTTTTAPLIATQLGKLHPITASLDMLSPGEGASVLATNIQPLGQILLSAGVSPYLAIKETKDSRVAIFTNTTGTIPPAIWSSLLQWFAYFPDASLNEFILRPEENDSVIVEYLLADQEIGSLMLTRPDRSTIELPLTKTTAGMATATFRANDVGLYLVGDGKKQIAYHHGNSHWLEWQQLATTDQWLGPWVRRTGGAVVWLGQQTLPPLQWTTGKQRGQGQWLSLLPSRAFEQTGFEVQDWPTPWLWLLLLLCSLAVSWRVRQS